MGRETESVYFPWSLSRQSNVKDWAGVQKALGRNPRGQCAESWPPDCRMCCYWLHPFLFGKCSFWIGRCFSVWAQCAKCPGSEGKAGVHARWQGLRLGETAELARAPAVAQAQQSHHRGTEAWVTRAVFSYSGPSLQPHLPGLNRG